jgi:replicative DNA helicase
MTRIKAMADNYKVIFINVGQPRKSAPNSKGRKITVDDFKGSGAWKDAANSVIIIHRDLNKVEDAPTAKGPYEDKCLVQVLKGRSLGKGASACFLTCFGEFGCFEEIDNIHEEEQ